jgi:hypothetical protein
MEERKTSFKDAQGQRDLEEHLMSEVIDRMKDPKIGVKQLWTEIDALQIPEASKRSLIKPAAEDKKRKKCRGTM